MRQRAKENQSLENAGLANLRLITSLYALLDQAVSIAGKDSFCEFLKETIKRICDITGAGTGLVALKFGGHLMGARYDVQPPTYRPFNPIALTLIERSDLVDEAQGNQSRFAQHICLPVYRSDDTVCGAIKLENPSPEFFSPHAQLTDAVIAILHLVSAKFANQP
ncbi:MAG: hypothetical protein CEN89_519 [Candidatus Berkelbacteria bacterium Licking1014_7]|uniref:GAF domain-containing protein n=1 Tax=Candidatus Berkelbacteria bacterium Licking1014_7 TaxID=2017147 RepID=A0A554LIN0_9BACT|nr:MAG: hypothetical protein CEN89_519 [Candidatus Berkelbacteria bacterium Licking1014_7]